MLRHRRSSDEEYVERMRRGLASFDRWRPLFIFFGSALVLLAALVAERALNGVINLVANVGMNQGAVVGGFMCGLLFGAGIGSVVYDVIRFRLDTLFDKRAERLMVRYYDRCHACEAAAENQRGKVEVI